MKIYLWCSLTHASEEYKNNIVKLKNKLRKDYIVFDFIGLINWTNEDVYKCDRNCVKTCDVMIAECSYPSTWLWYELWLWVEIWKTIFAFAQNKSKVSRMILWIKEPNFKFNRYNDFDDLYEKIKIMLEELENKL